MFKKDGGIKAKKLKGVVMEEKERYELFGEHCIKDNNPDARCQLLNTYQVYVILNEQDKEIIKLRQENQQLKQQVEELKGKRLEFYKDDVRQTQVINGVHFDIEQLLVFSEYVEHEKNISADKNKQINQLKQQLHDLHKKIVEDITNELSNNTSLYFEMRESTSIHCPNKEYEWFNYVRFRNYINTILKKHGGEDESNND